MILTAVSYEFGLSMTDAVLQLIVCREWLLPVKKSYSIPTGFFSEPLHCPPQKAQKTGCLNKAKRRDDRMFLAFTASVQTSKPLYWVHDNFVKCSFCSLIIMAALRSRCGHYIFALWFLLSFFLFFPRLISDVGDWMSTILPHMVWP